MSTPQKGQEMHVDFSIDVSGNILAGAASGALVAFISYVVLTVLVTLGGSLMTLGGDSGMFTKTNIGWMLLVIIVGAIAGGLLSWIGLPWWARSPLVLVILIGLYAAMEYHLYRQDKRRY